MRRRARPRASGDGVARDPAPRRGSAPPAQQARDALHAVAVGDLPGALFRIEPHRDRDRVAVDARGTAMALARGYRGELPRIAGARLPRRLALAPPRLHAG